MYYLILHMDNFVSNTNCQWNEHMSKNVGILTATANRSHA